MVNSDLDFCRKSKSCCFYYDDSLTDKFKDWGGKSSWKLTQGIENTQLASHNSCIDPMSPKFTICFPDIAKITVLFI